MTPLFLRLAIAISKLASAGAYPDLRICKTWQTWQTWQTWPPGAYGAGRCDPGLARAMPSHRFAINFFGVLFYAICLTHLQL
jgi:hypothetical protein